MKIYKITKLFQKKENIVDDKKKVLGSGIIGGLALRGTGKVINKYSSNKLYNSLQNINSEQKDLYNKLKQDIQKRGVYIEDDKKYGKRRNASYVRRSKELEKDLKNTSDKEIEDFYKRELNNINKDKKLTKKKKEILKYKLDRHKAVLKTKGKGGFIIDKDLKSGSVLSHEMGHEYYRNGEGKKKLGGILHKGNSSKLLNNTKIRRLGTLSAFVSGINAARHEKDGTEEGKISKYGYLVHPGARTITSVGSEAAASHRGLKLLKKHGASKKALKESRKNLAAALGTYIGGRVFDLGTSYLSRSAGKGVGKLIYNKNE